MIILVVVSGNLFLEKKDECQALQEENLALKKTLEKLQNTSQSQNNRMNQEQEVNILSILNIQVQELSVKLLNHVHLLPVIPVL